MKNLLILVLISITHLLSAQTVYKKGYIVSLEGDTTSGFILIKKQKLLYSMLHFKEDKKGDLQKYTPKDLKGYGFKRGAKYESIIIPIIENNFLVEPQRLEQKFIEVISFSSQYTFYKTYQDSDYSYYMKNNKGEIIPLILTKKEVDKYKIREGVYRLPNGETIQPNDEALVKASNNKTYIFKDNILYQVIPMYKATYRKITVENGCDLELQISKSELKRSSVASISDEIHSCLEIENELTRSNLSPQFSVIGTLANRKSSENIPENFERGILLELRENTISPNLSVGVGFSQSATLPLRQVVDFVEVNGKRFSNIIESTNINNIFVFKLNYHFLEGRNVRPYLALSSKSYNYTKSYESIFPSTELTVLTRTVNENYIGASVGIDIYCFKYLQLRLESTYNNTFEFQLGAGISLY